MVLEAKPYRRQPFDRSEMLYLLKVAVLVAVAYVFRRELAELLAFFWLFIPLLLFSYVWFKSIQTGDRLIDVVRDHVTLIPVAYAEGGRRPFFPKATLALVAANAAVFYLMRLLAPADLATLEDCFMFLPPAPVAGASLLSPLASMFLHASPGHLWGNMVFLWAFAPSIEERLGTRRFLLLYLATGMAGGLVGVAVWRLFLNSPLHGMGASGAVAGVMGIFMVRCYFKKLVIPLPVFGPIHAKLRVSSLPVLGFFFLSDLQGGIERLSGVQSHIGYWTHVGSMVAGMAMALLLKLHALAAEEKLTEAGLAAMASSHSRRDSVDSLLAALQLNPDNQEALAGLAREYACTRKPEGAELYQRAIALKLRADPAQALELFGEYRERYGQKMLEPGLQYRLAGVFYLKGEHEPAARLLEALILEPAVSGETRERSFFQLVILLAENNMLEAAHYRLEQFRGQFPGSPLVRAAEDKFVEMLKS